MKKRVFKAFTGVIVLSALLSGCAPVEPLPTPTGKPEVTIPDVTKKEALDALTDIMIAKGYITKTITDDNAVYYKRTHELYAAPPFRGRWGFRLWGKRHDKLPEARVSYDITETREGVRIVAIMKMILHPESPFQEVYDISRGRDARDIQDLLEQLKASLIRKDAV
jgi:hypothetical protein